jgi:hypothetical protein
MIEAVAMTNTIMAHAAKAGYAKRIESVEAKALNMPQLECPVDHQFAPGVYLRQITMPAGSFVIGHQHNTEHFNIVLKGRAAVLADGELLHVVAPCTFVSKPGVRKVLYIFEEMVWATVHPTTETDLLKLEEQLITKSESFKQHQLDMQKLRELVSPEVGL